jgi:glutamate-1-semialdehyde aminotransferase/spore coat polysaccharide biosynthesis protein SpsF (cytidylyltransferase family)
MRIVAVVQARMSSTRLPGKVLAEIEGRPLLAILLTRLSFAKHLDEIIVATSNLESDDAISDLVTSMGIQVYRGSIDDVRSRFIGAASKTKADCIVRITGDCPLTDPKIVDTAIEKFKLTNSDYVSNVNPPTFPDGLDVEVFSVSALRQAVSYSKSKEDIEHVTPFLRSRSFPQDNLALEKNLSGIRWTVDTAADMNVVRNIFSYFAPKLDFTWTEVLDLYKHRPELFEENSLISRNEGSSIGTGQKLWQRAKSVIPGGNMLLSKRSEMFLPGLWPSYFSRAKGSTVWDLDGKKYLDMSTMGVGTNILGYQNSAVDAAVKRAVESGTMSTLNCPEEVYLAERLVSINPWAQMVKLARTGGEANAVAIRIARAASGRDKVAVCGYHGWHDWYLSANLGDDQSLDGHLLPGLEPKGVPRALAGSIVTFPYNDFPALEALVAKGDIGTIKMEVIRTEPPKADFLSKVRKLATEKGIVLVFDECTSGFRETFGGIHKKYGVEPDIAVYGKALGNGFPITAVVGRSEVMDAAQSTFISSTFWTDRVGPVAALAALKEMEKLESWKIITEKGEKIQTFWRELFSTFPMQIGVTGIPALAGFASTNENFGVFKTFVTQELLKRGILGSNLIYSSITHSEKNWRTYKNAMADIVQLGSAAISSGNLDALLDGEPSHQGFRRLN